MLARGNRITRGTDYRTVVRRGRRCVSNTAITYVVTSAGEGEPRFGFIVSKQIGSAVVRNTVRRRLKAACAELLPELPSGTDVVIRALPASATVRFSQLRAEVTRCLRRKVSA